MWQSIGDALVNMIGLLDNLVTYSIAFKGIFDGVPVNFGLMALSTIENIVYPVLQVVLGYEQAINNEIQTLPFYVVNVPHIRDSYIPYAIDEYGAFSIGSQSNQSLSIVSPFANNNQLLVPPYLTILLAMMGYKNVFTPVIIQSV
ncbi:MAG: hypothetical protein EZS28_025561 [Streblomastix strix]|uniref:Uncharacterized protein n=1 Tax=Streblomastix strix TaxID=222440 RepID=A0A5J4V911_9EUKA|nr:MAG: hypothetical protein EZS28_025561 [Streblomastix strix]